MNEWRVVLGHHLHTKELSEPTNLLGSTTSTTTNPAPPHFPTCSNQDSTSLCTLLLRDPLTTTSISVALTARHESEINRTPHD